MGFEREYGKLQWGELNAGERGGSWRRFIFFGQSRVSAEEEEGDGMGGGLDYSVLEIICVPLVFRTHGAFASDVGWEPCFAHSGDVRHAIVYDNRLFCQEHVKLELGERSLEDFRMPWMTVVIRDVNHKEYKCTK